MPYRSDVAETPGIAVAILIHQYGYCWGKETVDWNLKTEATQRGLTVISDATDAFVVDHPDVPVRIGVYVSAKAVGAIRPMQAYDGAAVRSALRNTNRDGVGFFSVGNALLAMPSDLYRAGVFSKNVLLITCRESWDDPSPERVAREMWDRSANAIHIYVIAIETDPAPFAFLRANGGDVWPVQRFDELLPAMEALYRERILGERLPAERVPQPPSLPR